MAETPFPSDPAFGDAGIRSYLARLGDTLLVQIHALREGIRVYRARIEHLRLRITVWRAFKGVWLVQPSRDVLTNIESMLFSPQREHVAATAMPARHLQSLRGAEERAGLRPCVRMRLVANLMDNADFYSNVIASERALLVDLDNVCLRLEYELGLVSAVPVS